MQQPRVDYSLQRADLTPTVPPSDQWGLHTSISFTLPTFTQYVKLHMRKNKTCDLQYANVTGAYTSVPLPPLYWETLCSSHGDDINSLTHCIMNYTNLRVENTLPTWRVRCFSNNKSWVTPELKALLNKNKRTFISGNREKKRRVQHELKYKIRQAKDTYKKKL
ncbi:hypothetical protein Q8A73_003904 [Channa argus]|nr:hypothetical protein Q8A73_003904 [Channa argus]